MTLVPQMMKSDLMRNHFSVVMEWKVKIMLGSSCLVTDVEN